MADNQDHQDDFQGQYEQSYNQNEQDYNAQTQQDYQGQQENYNYEGYDQNNQEKNYDYDYNQDYTYQYDQNHQQFPDTVEKDSLSYDKTYSYQKEIEDYSPTPIQDKTQNDIDYGDQINWQEIAEKLPTELKDPVEKEKRDQLWRGFDANGNGYLSLAEVDKGIRDALQCDALFDAKPAIMRAFQYAKDYSPAKSAHGPDYVEKREFRILLVALRQRFEYLQAFRRIDSGNDGRVDLPEFLAARAAIERWVGPMEDPEVEFKKIDSDQGGQILFEEFCKWSIGKNLDLDDDDESDDNERAQPTSQREEPEHSVSPTEGDGLATHTVGATNEAVAEQQEVAENPHLKEVLEKIVETQPETEFLDLQNQNIVSIQQIGPYIKRLMSLKDLNLENNPIQTLADTPDLGECLGKIQNLNLNGVPFADLEREVEALAALPNLRSLYATLQDESQVDTIMQTLVDLEFLNGLPVEREYLEERDSFGTDSEEVQESDSIRPGAADSIREVPEEDSDGTSRNQDLLGEVPRSSQGTSVERAEARGQEAAAGDGSFDGSYADRQVFDQSYTYGGPPRSISAASKVQSEAARARPNPLAGLGSPEVEYSAYEHPSAEVCEDYQNVLEDYGIDYQGVREIARAYDQLRQTRRHSATMIDHNNDLLQAQLWQKRFKGMIERIKAQRHQESKRFQSLDAKRILLAQVQDSLSDYLGYTDKECQGVVMRLNHYHCQITDDAIAMYRAEASENPMYEQVTELRQANKRLEEKYQQELSANHEKDKLIEDLGAKLKALEKQNQKKDIELREVRTRERTTSLRTSPPQAPTQRTEVGKPKKKSAHTGSTLGPVQNRTLTLKQLKELINDIFQQKQRYDRKCRDSGLPLETLEQYMYTYLNQRYGLKPLIIEWTVAIVNAIAMYQKADHEALLFGKILKNDCDEPFRQIQVQIKDTLRLLIKAALHESHPYKCEPDLNLMVAAVQDGFIDEWIWRQTLEKMYDTDDQAQLVERFQVYLEAQGPPERVSQSQATNRKSRGGAPGRGAKLAYSDFQKAILDFQLQEHERFLDEYTHQFKAVDRNQLGVIDSQQFRRLLNNMDVVCSESVAQTDTSHVDGNGRASLVLLRGKEEVEYLLQKLDPYGVGLFTYTQTVQHLSSYMVPSDNPHDPAPLPLLEKFANLLDLESRPWTSQVREAVARQREGAEEATPTPSVGMTDSELDRKIEQKLVAYLGPSPTKTKAKKKKKKASKKSNEQYLSKATKKTKAKQPLRAPRGLSQGSAGSRGTDDDLARQTDQGNHISIQIGGTQQPSLHQYEEYEQYQVQEYEKYDYNQYTDYDQQHEAYGEPLALPQDQGLPAIQEQNSSMADQFRSNPVPDQTQKVDQIDYDEERDNEALKQEAYKKKVAMLAAMFKKPNIQIQTTELPQSIQNPPEGPAIPPPPPFIPRAPVTKEGIMNLLQNHIKSKFIPPPPFHKSMTIRAPGTIPPAPQFVPQKKGRTQQEILDLLKLSIFRKMVPPPPFHQSMTISKPIHVSLLPELNQKIQSAPPPAPFSTAMSIKPPIGTANDQSQIPAIPVTSVMIPAPPLPTALIPAPPPAPLLPTTIIPAPPSTTAMIIKPPGFIPPAPKFNPKPPVTKDSIMNLLKSNIQERMKNAPPPPFSKAMTINKPQHIPQAPILKPHQPPGIIPPAPSFIPRPPKSQNEILSLLKGHIAKKMRIPPPPFSKAMAINLPTIELNKTQDSKTIIDQSFGGVSSNQSPQKNKMAGLLTQFFAQRVAQEKEKIMEDFSSDEDNNNANKGEESDGSADSNGSYIIMTKEKVQTALDLKIKEMFAKAFTKPKGEAQK